MRFAVGIVLMCCLPIWTAAGDTLVLTDTETLTGDVVRVSEGALVFRTSLAGQMMVPMDTIKSLTTERNLVVTLADGNVLYGKFIATPEGPRLLPLNGSEAQPIALADVTEAIRIPSSSSPDTAGATSSWTLSGGTGVALRDAQERSVESSSRIVLRGELKQSEVDASAGVSMNSGDMPSRAEGQLLWRMLRDEGAQPYGEIQLEHEPDYGLRLRGTLNLGLWDFLIENGPNSLAWFAGVSLNFEDWDVSSVGGGRAGDATDNRRGETALQLRLRYSRALWGGTRFDEDLSFYPSLSEVGELRIRNEAAVAVPLSENIAIRLHLRLDFDNVPGLEDLDNWGATVGAGLVWAF